MAPTTLGRVKKGPGYAIARWVPWLFPKCNLQVPHWPWHIQTPPFIFTPPLRSSHLYPNPHHLREHLSSSRFPPNSFEPLHAPRPCPWHLPQEAPQQATVSLPHLALGRFPGTLAPCWSLLGQVEPCALRGRVGEETITLTHGSGLKDAMGP